VSTPIQTPGPHDWEVQEEYDQTLQNGMVETWLRWKCRRCQAETRTAKASYVRPPPRGCVPLAEDEVALVGHRGRPGTPIPVCPCAEHGPMVFVPPTETESGILTVRYMCKVAGCSETKVVRAPVK